VTTTTEKTADAEVIETGEQRDALGRRRTPADQRELLLTSYRASGLTQREFARREGINYTTFCTWAQAERRNGRLPLAPAGAKGRRRPPAGESARLPFVEVQVSSAASVASSETAGLEVRLPDGTLLRGGSAEELAKLARALRGLP
jgi:hypothetical protein